jgi:hypothetical protein
MINLYFVKKSKSQLKLLLLLSSTLRNPQVLSKDTILIFSLSQNESDSIMKGVLQEVKSREGSTALSIEN